MPSIPAICERCNTIFPSGFGGRNSNMIMIDSRGGTCPKCGGIGEIQNGLYQLLDDTLESVYQEDRVTLFRVKDIIEKPNGVNTEQEIMLMREELKKSNNLQEAQNEGLKEILNKVESLEEKQVRENQFKMLKIILGVAIPILLSFGDVSLDEFKNQAIEKIIEVLNFNAK